MRLVFRGTYSYSKWYKGTSLWIYVHILFFFQAKIRAEAHGVFLYTSKRVCAVTKTIYTATDSFIGASLNDKKNILIKEH